MKQIILILISLFLCFGSVFGAELFKETSCFEVLQHKGKTTLALCVDASKYMRPVVYSFAAENLPDDVDSAEWLISKEKAHRKKGQYDQALSMFTEPAAKKRAHERIERKKKRKGTFLTEWEELEYVSKFTWGPYVRVRLDLRNREKSFPSVVYLKKNDKGYAFTEEVGSQHVFSYIASLHPWNKDTHGKGQPVSLEGLSHLYLRSKAENGRVDYLSEGGNDYVSGDMVLAVAVESFNDGGVVLTKEKNLKGFDQSFKKEIRFLHNFFQSTSSKDKVWTLEMLDDRLRSRVTRKPHLLDEMFKRYAKMEELRLLSIIKSDHADLIYYQPKMNGKYRDIEVFCLAKKDGRLLLSEKFEGILQMASKLLSETETAQAVHSLN